MQTPPSVSGDSNDLEEARFRDRMARISLNGSASRQRSRARDGKERSGSFRLGWLGWLVIDGLVVLGTVAAVVVWQPVETCRAQEKTVGFYAGDRVEKCIRRGVVQRLSNADQRIKMILRASGH